MKKEDIRRLIRSCKSLLDDVERRAAADRVFNRLEQSAAFMMADTVLIYHSLPDELSTIAFLNKWSGTKRFYLPRVNGVNLDLLPYAGEDALVTGAYAIREPEGDEAVSIDEIDLVVVPGVAYDRAGNRVGRGKGFYDRLLRSCRATMVGIGYDFQLVDQIDTEPHDVAVDIVITESGYFTPGNRPIHRRRRRP